MAGGPHAEIVPCMVCLGDRVLTRATRVAEGVETDHYVCDAGHDFGMTFVQGPPSEPQWPPAPELEAFVTAD